MRRTLLLLSLIGVLSAPLVAQADHGNNKRAHWRRAMVSVLDSVSASWDQELLAGANTWNTGTIDVDYAVEESKSGRRFRKKCPFGDGAVRVCNFRYGNSGKWRRVAGLAQYSYLLDSRHIIRARIRLNDTNTSDRLQQAVTTHELGHTLGLGHRPQGAEATSCMTRTVSATQISPDPHDWDEVNLLHNHSHAASPSEANATTTADASDDNVRVRKVGNIVHVTEVLPAV